MSERDEQAILEFLSAYPESFLSAVEIARKAAGRSRFTEEPRWAYPALSNLMARGLIEMNEGGHYCIKARRR